jgi:DNA repair photolyase
MFYSGRVRVEYREEPCKTALNPVKGMPFAWSLNPYMGCVHRCTFCYVRAFEQRAERPSGERYGLSIRVKVNVAEVLRLELTRKAWDGGSVAIGAATDPYQPAEGRYRLTRGCIEALADAANPFHIVTRGPLVVRDVDVLAKSARRAAVSVSFSVPTLDEEVWRRTEPGTAPPRQRLRALSVLREAGIDARVAVAPVLPGISDRPEQLAEVVRAARDAGATNVWASVVNLRPGTREHFLAHVQEDWPELAPFYERLYGSRAYPPRKVEQRVRNRVAAARKEHRFRHGKTLRPREPAVQLTLV